MKNCILFILLCGTLARIYAQRSTFTYQGRLNDGPAPANGVYDLKFSLFGQTSGGTALTGPLDLPTISISKGLFTVQLDFGVDIFTGADRWLEVAVRPAGNEAFTTLLPRQPISATPYALTALKVPGIDGHSLRAADGNPAEAVFVDDSGNVGVGTTSPVTRLHVVSAAGESPPPSRLQSLGTAGFAAGWDFYHGNTGRGYVGVPDLGAPFAPGELLIFGAPGTKVSLWPGGVRSLTADTAGRIGIGTSAPESTLDVRGDIRMGTAGQFRATSGLESLSIVRGVVNAEGTILEGRGFTVTKTEVGSYTIGFTAPFSDTPAVTVTAESGLTRIATVTSVSASAALVRIHKTSDLGSFYIDNQFQFIAIGPPNNRN